MGKLEKEGSKFLFCFVIGMIAGSLLGATLVSTFVSYKIDTFYERITTLENTLNDKNAQLESLEESVNNKNIILEDIKVIVMFRENEEEDEIDKIEIKEAVQEKYSSLLGKEIKDIDADILAEVIDKRIFKIGDKEYKLFIRKVILTEILKVWVEVERI